MIRVVIADDHPVVRAGLRQIVTGQPDMQVAGESADGDGVLAVLAGTPADVLLLDLAMPGAPFPGLLKHVLSRYPGVRAVPQGGTSVTVCIPLGHGRPGSVG